MAGRVKRLLAISWGMPPLPFPRSIQVARTLAELARTGWDSTVVCVNPSSLRSGRLRDRSLEERYRHSYRAVPVDSVEDSILLLGLWRIAPRLQLLPDGKRLWVGAAFRAARRVAERERFSVIVSFAQPWSDHLVGLRMRRATGLPWVAHFSDPWVDSPYLANAPAWQRRLWARMEAEVVREADRLVFVAPQTADLVMRKYPEPLRAKARVVPHGYEPDGDPARVPPEPHAALRLVYTGTVFAGRTPDGLLDALERLRMRAPLEGRMEITFVGQVLPGYSQRVTARGLDGIVRFRGPLPFGDAQRAAAGGDVLLVIDTAALESSVFLPSKLVEYFAFRKPIFALTPAAGATADLLRALGMPMAPPDDPAAIASALADLMAAHQSGRLTVPRQFDAVVAPYRIETTARAFGRIMEECVAGATEPPWN